MDIPEEVPYPEYILTRASLRPFRSCLPSDSFNHSTIFSPSPTPMFSENEGEDEDPRQQTLENLIQQHQWEGIVDFLQDLPGHYEYILLKRQLQNRALNALQDNNRWNEIISLILADRGDMHLREQAFQALLDGNVINFLMENNQWTTIIELALSAHYNIVRNHGPVTRVREQAITALRIEANPLQTLADNQQWQPVIEIALNPFVNADLRALALEALLNANTIEHLRAEGEWRTIVRLVNSSLLGSNNATVALRAQACQALVDSNNHWDEIIELARSPWIWDWPSRALALEALFRRGADGIAIIRRIARQRTVRPFTERAPQNQARQFLENNGIHI